MTVSRETPKLNWDFLQGFDRRSLENPALSLSDPEAWDETFGLAIGSESGVKVTKKRSLMYAPVWSAVSLISGACARLPLNCKRSNGDDSEIDRMHPAYRPVRRKPNDEQDRFQFWQTVFLHKLLWNNAYVWIEQAKNGRPRKLWPLLPDRTAPERLLGSQIYAKTGNKPLAKELDGALVYTTEVHGKLFTFFPSEILHFRGLSIDGMEGCDLISHARNAIGLAIAQENFGSRFFKNGARMGGVLEVPATMTKPAMDKVESGFRKSYEDASAWFKTFVARDGVKFHQAAFNPGDSQLVEASEAQARQVARFFKLQPSKLGIKDSSSYNSKSEDNQSFLDDTLSDHLAAVEAQCEDKLLTTAEQESESHFFEYDTSPLLRLDAPKRFGVYQIGLKNRIFTRNEVRRKEGLPPVEGGDEFDNFATTGAVGVKTEPADPKAPADETKNRSLATWKAKIAARAEHKSRSAAGFEQWLATNLKDFRTGDDKLSAADREAALSSLLTELRAALAAHRTEGAALAGLIAPILETWLES